jgi:hypothetical protein
MTNSNSPAVLPADSRQQRRKGYLPLGRSVIELSHLDTVGDVLPLNPNRFGIFVICY